MTGDTRIVNLTGHDILVFEDSDPRGAVLARWKPSGTLARLRERTRDIERTTIDGSTIPCWSVRYDDVVEGLPEPRAGVLLLVSRVLAGVVRRDDLVFPYPEVRDEYGMIVGCGGLARFDHDGAAPSRPEGE